MTDDQHFIGKIAQKAIIENDGKILLIRDPREPRIIWELPGGRLHKDETPSEGLKREVLEELGIHITPGVIIWAEPHDHNGPHISLIYIAELDDPDTSLVLQVEEIAEAKWVDRSEVLKLPIYPEHVRALEKYFELRDK